jgi:ABC-2 type transport system ATP-binding protein
MIELTQITKKYGDHPAVNNLNLSVSKGEIFGFIGPNGAGKTTTIKIMGGVLQPSWGACCSLRTAMSGFAASI